jgi:hypothetical protein
LKDAASVAAVPVNGTPAQRALIEAQGLDDLRRTLAGLHLRERERHAIPEASESLSGITDHLPPSHSLTSNVRSKPATETRCGRRGGASLAPVNLAPASVEVGFTQAMVTDATPKSSKTRAKKRKAEENPAAQTSIQVSPAFALPSGGGARAQQRLRQNSDNVPARVEQVGLMTSLQSQQLSLMLLHHHAMLSGLGPNLNVP